MMSTPLSSLPALPVTLATRAVADRAGIVVLGSEVEVLAVVGLERGDAPACYDKQATMPPALCAGCTWAPGCSRPGPA